MVGFREPEPDRSCLGTAGAVAAQRSERPSGSFERGVRRPGTRASGTYPPRFSVRVPSGGLLGGQ
jgi:hypothetical protein